MVAKYVQCKKNWDEHLDTCVFAYNTSCHESTTCTPFILMFGRRPYLPGDINVSKSSPEENLQEWKKETSFSNNVADMTEKRQSILMAAKIKIRNAQKKQKFYYDRKHCKPGCFDIGSKVLLKDLSRKKRKGGNNSRWTGPYIIEKNIGKGIYMLSSISNPKLKVKREQVHVI